MAIEVYTTLLISITSDTSALIEEANQNPSALSKLDTVTRENLEPSKAGHNSKNKPRNRYESQTMAKGSKMTIKDVNLLNSYIQVY